MRARGRQWCISSAVCMGTRWHAVLRTHIAWTLHVARCCVGMHGVCCRPRERRARSGCCRPQGSVRQVSRRSLHAVRHVSGYAFAEPFVVGAHDLRVQRIGPTVKAFERVSVRAATLGTTSSTGRHAPC